MCSPTSRAHRGWDCARAEGSHWPAGAVGRDLHPEIIGRGRRLRQPHKQCPRRPLRRSGSTGCPTPTGRLSTTCGASPPRRDGDGPSRSALSAAGLRVAGYARPNGHERPSAPCAVKRPCRRYRGGREPRGAQAIRPAHAPRAQYGWSQAAPTMFWKRFQFWPVRMRESRRGSMEGITAAKAVRLASPLPVRCSGTALTLDGAEFWNDSTANVFTWPAASAVGQERPAGRNRLEPQPLGPAQCPRGPWRRSSSAG